MADAPGPARFCGVEDLRLRPAARELVEHSLVQFDLGTARYRLLHTVRLFAAGLADEAGEFEALRRNHAAHFSALALEARAVNFVPEDAWLPRLQAEVENLHAALRTLLKEARGVEALANAVTLTTFWWTTSRHREGIGSQMIWPLSCCLLLLFALAPFAKNPPPADRLANLAVFLGGPIVTEVPIEGTIGLPPHSPPMGKALWETSSDYGA